ncbi:hypothetical protein J7L68_05900 [bacterium]|nr:hypothetical protein [bacterium]
MKLFLKHLYFIIISIVLGFTILQAQPLILDEGTPGHISIHVSMVGASWTFNEGGVGSENTTAAIFSFSTVADTFAATGDTIVHPCDIIHRVFWLENTGGITLDFDTYLDNGRTGPDWSHDAMNITCPTVNAENKFAGAYSFELSDGDSLTPAPPSWIVLPEDSVGSIDEFEGLWAEDPYNTGDNIWDSQDDQREYHIEYIMPISSSTLNQQHIYSVIIGKLSD